MRLDGCAEKGFTYFTPGGMEDEPFKTRLSTVRYLLNFKDFKGGKVLILGGYPTLFVHLIT